MVMEFILILMEPGMKATGLMIFKMEKDSKSGKMDPYLKANGTKASSMDTA